MVLAYGHHDTGRNNSQARSVQTIMGDTSSPRGKETTTQQAQCATVSTLLIGSSSDYKSSFAPRVDEPWSSRAHRCVPWLAGRTQFFESVILIERRRANSGFFHFERPFPCIAAMTPPQRVKKSPPPTYVVVVESHQHALEHYHTVIRHRRRKRQQQLTSKWSMIHFDSHPDLACPRNNIPAASCFIPRTSWPVKAISEGQVNKSDFPDEDDERPCGKNLYELLDSTPSGIAEWILPLVLAGDLAVVNWIRGQASSQLPLGHSSFHVGAWVPNIEKRGEVTTFLDLPRTAAVKVDLQHPYYFDDSSVVPSSELLIPQSLQLRVSDLSVPVLQGDNRTPSLTRDDWALDICLDYFVCLNPFLTELEACDLEFSNALVSVVRNSRLFQTEKGILFPHTKSLEGRAEYEKDLFAFRTLLMKLLHAALDASKCSCIPVADGISFEPDIIMEEFEALLDFYSSKQQGYALLNKLLRSLNESAGSSELIALAVDAIPNITMPHCPTDKESMRQSVSEQLDAVVECISEAWLAQGTDPFIITIARSSCDGFTPECIVEDLQNKLIRRLHSVLCGCDQISSDSDTRNVTPEDFSPESQDCRWSVIFDYGQWEGSSFDDQ